MKEPKYDQVKSAEPRCNECETTSTRYSQREMITLCMHRTLSEASTDKLLNCSIRCAKAKSCYITNDMKKENEEEEEEHEMQQINSREYFQQVKSKREISIKQIGRSLYQMSCDFHHTHFANNV